MPQKLPIKSKMVNNKMNTFANNGIERKLMSHTKCPKKLKSYSVELFVVNIQKTQQYKTFYCILYKINII